MNSKLYSLQYAIRTLSPVVLTDEGGDPNMVRTRDYFTGGVVRGMLAQRYIGRERWHQAHKDERFYRWFVAGGLAFLPAYPALDDSKETLPLPLSIQINKKGDEIRDVAIAGKLEGGKQYGRFGYIDGESITKVTPLKTLTLHQARLNRCLGHSQDGNIFNYEALQANQWFIGSIRGGLQELESLKNHFGEEFETYIGRSSHTEYGRVKFKLGNIIPSKADWEDLVDADEICLTFISPVIVNNQFGFPDLSVAALAAELKQALGGYKFKVVQAFLRTENVENYRAVWRSKSVLAKAFQAGSRLVIKFEKGINAALAEEICKLEMSGIGERRAEGFGFFQVSLLEDDKYYKEQAADQQKPQQPVGRPPELVKTIFTAVLRKKLVALVEQQAADDVADFSEMLPKITTSLLGRIERILLDANSLAEFNATFDKSGLKSVALENLAAIKNKGRSKTLLEHFKTSDTPLHTIINDAKIEDLKRLSDIKLDATSFVNEYYKTYWLAFLRIMRKKLKQKGE